MPPSFLDRRPDIILLSPSLLNRRMGAGKLLFKLNQSGLPFRHGPVGLLDFLRQG